MSLKPFPEAECMKRLIVEKTKFEHFELKNDFFFIFCGTSRILFMKISNCVEVFLIPSFFKVILISVI